MEVTSVVIDSGSSSTKAGFAGDDAPRAVFPSLVGYLREGVTPTHARKDAYVGDEAHSKRDLLNMNYPVQQGLVSNWEDMERLYNWTFFNEMSVDPGEHPVLLTEVPFSPWQSRQKMAQMMFESFNSPAVYWAMQPVLPVYAAGRTTGLVVDIGEGVGHAVPVYEGYAVRHAIGRLDVAGQQLTEYMARLLLDRGLGLDLGEAREVKERLCYVAREGAGEAGEASVVLPSGQVVSAGGERSRVPEALFDPSLVGRDGLGVQEVACNGLLKCDGDLRRDLLYHVVLSGGTTMLPGIGERLREELEGLLMFSGQIGINVPPERKYSSWIGGSILASLSVFPQMWVSKEEYTEYGTNFIRSKCF